MNELKDNPGNGNKNSENNDRDSSAAPEKQIHPLISPIAAAIIGLAGGFFLYQIVGGALTLLIFGMDMKSAPVNAVRLLTAGGQILFILLPALVFAKWFYEDVSAIIRIKVPDWNSDFNSFASELFVHTKLYIFLPGKNIPVFSEC
jgi:hypothetical protein